MVFFGPGADSSSNCYGYSPYSLSTYLLWLRPLIQSDRPRKQVILSITGTIDETAKMLDALQAFADELGAVIAAEFNASCPNIRGATVVPQTRRCADAGPSAQVILLPRTTRPS